MTRITGADTDIALKVASTFGTAATVGTGDRLQVESITPNRNPEELTANPIGAGVLLATDSQQGGTTPTIAVNALEGYNDASVAAEAVFWGIDSVLAQGAGGAYIHSLMNNENWNTRYLTYDMVYAYQSVMEAASCVVTKYSHTYESPPNYGRVSYELLANDLIVQSASNSYAVVNATTVADSERLVIEPTDEFLINGQSTGALSSPTDRYPILSLVTNYVKEQTSPREMKGSSGNGEPIPTGNPPLQAEIVVTFKSLDESQWLAAARAGSEFKASLTITGSLISGVIYKQKKMYWPRLKLIKEPEYAPSTGGINPLVLTFKCLAATSNPTGMASIYPMTTVINTKSTSYLA